MDITGGDGFGGGKTIDEFCRDWRISRSFFYLMRSRGEAPAVVRSGNVQRISHQAEQSWAQAREAAGETNATNRPQHAPVSARGLDFYETPDVATIALLSAEPDLLGKFIFEPCCGRNAITRVLRSAGISVYACDIVDYGTDGQDGQADFFETRTLPDPRINAIVSNPPYGRKLAARFVRHALTLVSDVYALLPLTFLELTDREDILRAGSGFRRVLVFADRLPRMHRDGWTGNRASATQAFAWMYWRQGFPGPATITRTSAKEPAWPS